MYETRASRHAESVLGALSHFMQDPRVLIKTPSGATMLPARGLFAGGSAVMAPGIDDCSPRRPATVISTGVREGWDGRWCLVHYRGDRVPALVREEDLLEAGDDGGGFEAPQGSGLAAHAPVMVLLP
jgi:hypothetical protein